MAKCANCSKVVNKKSPGAQCNKCNKWYHGTCAAITLEQLTALSTTDAVDWQCRGCMLVGGKKKRISVILPDPDEEESEVEATTPTVQDNILSEIRQEIRQLRQTVKDIIRDELQNTLQFYSVKIDEYEKQLKDQEMRFKILENQCKDMSNTYKNLTLKNEVLEQKLNKIEQTQICNDLELCGIPVKENEDINKIAISLSQFLKQKTDDITRVYRKKKHSRPGTAQDERAMIDAPIIISLREGRRQQWCAAAKNIKMYLKDLVGKGEEKIHLRESLSPTTSYLYGKQNMISEKHRYASTYGAQMDRL